MVFDFGVEERVRRLVLQQYLNYIEEVAVRTVNEIKTFMRIIASIVLGDR